MKRRVKLIKLKDILLEFVDRDITSLMDYINSSTEDKIFEVVNMVGEQNVIQWFIENDGVEYNILYDYRPYQDEIMKYESIHQMQKEHPELYDEFMDLMKGVVSGKQLFGPTIESFLPSFGITPDEIPTWRYLSEPAILKNQWLVHATNFDAIYSIFKDGFIRGVEDMSKLGLTTWYDGESFEKKGGGYNFAYTPEDFSRYGLNPYGGGTKYGDGENIVVFRASGIRCWHKTDVEYQVIFNGKTARDMVPVMFVDEKWAVISDMSKKDTKQLFASEDVNKVVDWVQKNYNQYRKSIGWGK